MLFKLSYKNIKRSIKDYEIYFLTLLFGVSIFYIFNSIETQAVTLDISNNMMQIIKIMSQVLSGISVFVSIILGCLIVYASRFLMKRRKREFGIYMTLGMSKKQISSLLFVETVIIGLVSLGIGLLVGIFGSYLVSGIVANLFKADMTRFTFVFSEKACAKTCLYFGIIYIVVAMFQMFIIRKSKLIDLISANKKGESKKNKNMLCCVIVFILAVVTLGIAYYLAIEKTFGNVNGDKMLLLAIFLGCLGTFLLFWSISGMVLKILINHKELYYRKLNSFTFRQVSSQINTNVVSMSVICILLFITICLLATGFSIKRNLDESLEKQTPVDYQMIISNDKSDYDLEDVQKKLDSYLSGNEMDKYKVKSHNFLRGLKGKSAGDLKWLEGDNQSITTLIYEYIFPVSEYNEYLRYSKKKTCELKDNEFMIYSTYVQKDINNQILEHNRHLRFQGNNFDYDLVCNSKTVNEDQDFLGPDAMKNGYIVVPDNVYKTLEKNAKNTGNLTMYGNKEISIQQIFDNEEFKKNEASDFYKVNVTNILSNSESTLDSSKVEQGLVHDFQEEIIGKDKLEAIKNENKNTKAENDIALVQEATGLNIYYINKKEVVDNSVGIGAMSVFIALYLGIIFMLSSAVLLSLKNLSESVDNTERYRMLKKIGAENKLINASLAKQIGIFFFAPFAVAVIHTIFGMKFAMYILKSMDQKINLPSVIVAIIVIIVFYSAYYLITYLQSLNIIKTDENKR
ncbi:putative ABC transport system permease protein [Lachnospiraceae bacterium C7]|nr:putative ABC transport system permease protein [Lachnospiraceae bacterium C7]